MPGPAPVGRWRPLPSATRARGAITLPQAARSTTQTASNRPGPSPLSDSHDLGDARDMDTNIARVVVGVDGSAAAEVALRWSASLAVSADATVIAVNAFDNTWSQLPPGQQAELVSERRDLLTSTWTRTATDLGATVETHLDVGDPRGVLMEAAKTVRADLVVLGRTGRGGGPGFLHLGSVVEYAAHHSTLPLAVIPTAQDRTIERVIVGVDGSRESTGAVRWAKALAVTTGASVVAVTVQEPFLEWTPSDSPRNWRRLFEQQIQQWTSELVEAGVVVDHVVKRDLHPADGLLGVASARDGDLLIVGTRGAGGFSGLRAGGVAMKIVHRASMPILLVPPDN